MTDLIDRNSLLNSLEKFAPEKHDALVEMLIKKEPTVDAVPVRHGKWESSRPDAPRLGFYYCSLCGRKRTSPQDRYCPNCGAKMDSEEEE